MIVGAKRCQPHSHSVLPDSALSRRPTRRWRRARSALADARRGRHDRVVVAAPAVDPSSSAVPATQTRWPRCGAHPQHRRLRCGGIRADIGCSTPPRGRADALIDGRIGAASVSFFVDKLYRHKVSRGEDLQCLQRLLQRIETVVLEAEGRHITNQAMLRQLQMLREGMYRGYYLVDAVKHRINDEVGDHSFSFPKQRQTKRLCFSSRTFTMAFQGVSSHIPSTL
ncbi:hypothetical protein GUJ93_ZPchr0007g3692 [Zizania palustris]|uniref:Rx N-terminal domain-containing protein n=1 Tax=Zizania palustris TaxID=103762 RepID=A0A8J5VMR0_ZIZPA|nr:hypothetical protein GUJ93_ZPchr0007g3692 [Zizania palustris]